MDEKSADKIPEEELDRTIIIQPDGEPSAGKGKAAPAAPAEPPRAAAVTPVEEGAFQERHSILADLGNFLFPRRSVVDDTIELIRSGKDELGSDLKALEIEETPVAEVEELYAVDPKPFASGGQGSVSLAVDRALGCSIAMKSLHEHLLHDSNARQSFIKEAKLTASLDHPSIVPIHGLFRDENDGMHLAMKLISGHTLSAYLRKIVSIYEKKGVRFFDEQKSLRNRIDIFLRVCDAMEHAHSRNIIHRDLKPENIMIGRHRETYITDWGLAVPVKEGQQLTKITGTPAFIAPEVLTTRKADFRSDIYSLGIILFELVTLKPAFPEKDLTTLLKQVKLGQHAPVTHLFHCHIDNDLKAVILKAIAVDPEKRYQQVSQLAEDLRRCLANEETTARPDNIFTKACRWGVKHRRGMLLAMLLLLLFGVGGFARMLYREILWSTERRLWDNAIGEAYREVNATATQLGKSLQKIEYQLDRLQMNLSFSSLKVNVPAGAEKKLFISLAEYKKSPPPSLVYSKSYRHPIDTESSCVFNYLGKKIDFDQLRYFANTASFMRRAVLDLPLGAEKSLQQKAAAELMNEGKAIKSIYFSLPDGTFACYPGSRDDFPDDYYPPGRDWYKLAAEAGGQPVWTEPYRDSGVHGELVVTCSMAVYGAQRRFVGFAGLDFSLTKLAERLLGPNSKSNPGTCEKLLLNTKGEVLFRMTPEGRPIMAHFNDPRLLRRMGKMKYGTIHTQRGDREMVLAFASLDAMGVIYAEYMDAATLLEEQRKNSGDELLSGQGGFGAKALDKKLKKGPPPKRGTIGEGGPFSGRRGFENDRVKR